MAAPLIRFQPRIAFKAAVALAKDPDDLPQVFTIVEALSLDSLSRIHARMQRTSSGQALLATRPDIVDRLADRDALAKLPEGTVGRGYLDFVTRENISAEGIRAAAVEGAIAKDGSWLPAPLDWVHGRMRDTHDLWHVVTGFQGDVVGEIGLLAFLFAQTRNPGIGVILGVGVLKLWRYPEARALMRTWYRIGKRATWLPAIDWERFLARPLDEVRAELGITQPARYTPVRTHELRAA